MATPTIAELQHNLIQAQKETIQAQLKMIETLAHNIEILNRLCKEGRSKKVTLTKSKS